MSKESPRLVRLLDCARCLIQSNDKLLHTRSRSTQCTALHVALRNYGDYFPIIHLLLESDAENFMVKQRNLYGDLPLHVACSVGVPMNVLRLVLQKTVHAVEKHGDLPHSLVWSTNIAGFTAVDLEWMRHIEGGRGFHETRSFYPLETSGIRWHCSRQDEFYRDLLRDAVDQVIKTDRTSSHSMSNRERAQEPFRSSPGSNHALDSSCPSWIRHASLGEFVEISSSCCILTLSSFRSMLAKAAS